MIRVPIIGSLVVAAVLGACGGEGGADGGSASGDLGVVRTEAFRMTGAFEGESLLVTPCSDREATLELALAPVVIDLVALHAELVPQLGPFEAIFVDLYGEAVQEGDEFSFEVLDVYRASWEDWGCGWVPSKLPLRFAASGSEPGWSLHVGADSTVTLSNVEGASEGAVETLEGSLAAGWTVTGSVQGESYTLRLNEESCRDPMSGGWSHLSATLVWRGQTLSGCGFIGDATDVL